MVELIENSMMMLDEIVCKMLHVRRRRTGQLCNKRKRLSPRSITRWTKCNNLTFKHVRSFRKRNANKCRALALVLYAIQRNTQTDENDSITSMYNLISAVPYECCIENTGYQHPNAIPWYHPKKAYLAISQHKPKSNSCGRCPRGAQLYS